MLTYLLTSKPSNMYCGERLWVKIKLMPFYGEYIQIHIGMCSVFVCLLDP